MSIPQDPGTPGEPTYFGGEDVVGLLINGVLLDSHEATWAYDSCVGHSDRKHQYHYHIPPFCMLKAMGIPAPDSPDWWINDAGTEVRAYADMAAQFPSSASVAVSQLSGASFSSPLIGFARDGFPIFGPYDEEGMLMTSTGGSLDECNGKTDSKGNYGYYLTVDPPFAPPCLRGEKGVFSYITTEKTCPAAGIKNTFVTQSEISKCADASTFEEAVNCAFDEDPVVPRGDVGSGADGKQTLVTMLALVAVALALA